MKTNQEKRKGKREKEKKRKEKRVEMRINNVTGREILMKWEYR